LIRQFDFSSNVHHTKNSSPFVRPVREKLGSLCLPHRMISCSRGSANRDKMIAKTKRFQVPFLVDPNTGIEMYESAEIVEYLEAVYTVKK
jgi:glutathione S-transferase